MNYFERLKKRVNKKEAIISIIGVGYVGLALLREFDRKGFRSVGIDINLKKFKKLNLSKKAVLTSNYSEIKNSDVIIITLPTPLDKKMSPDLKIIRNSLNKMKKFLKKGQLISFESTTYPGTTKELFIPIIKNKKFKLGEDFFLAYSPERVSPELKVKNKTIKYNLTNTPKIVSGYTKNCKILGKLIYEKIIKKIYLASTLEIAETTKMIENTFRSVNIALVNELKMFLTHINIDIHECIDLAGTKPFGFTKFLPGPGYGGHCIPIDPFYLYWLAKKNNVNLDFIKTSGIVNRKITDWISKKIILFFKKKFLGKKKVKIFILGVSYKPDIDDTRESPALKIMEKFKEAGIDIEYSDPYVKQIKYNGILKKSKPLNVRNFKKYPIVLIATNHSVFNYKLIAEKSQFLFDARNSIKNRKINFFKL